MNRRDLLRLSGSTAVLLVLPLPAIASPQPVEVDYDLSIDKIEAISKAFDILEDYKFSLSEKAELFGLYGFYFKNKGLDNLRDFVLSYILTWGNRDGWSRVQFLIEIRRKLDEQFDSNVTAQLEWMKKREAPFSTQSLRDLMTTTHYMDLYDAVRLLGGDTA